MYFLSKQVRNWCPKTLNCQVVCLIFDIYVYPPLEKGRQLRQRPWNLQPPSSLRHWWSHRSTSYSGNRHPLDCPPIYGQTTVSSVSINAVKLTANILVLIIWNVWKYVYFCTLSHIGMELSSPLVINIYLKSMHLRWQADINHTVTSWQSRKLLNKGI